MIIQFFAKPSVTFVLLAADNPPFRALATGSALVTGMHSIHYSPEGTSVDTTDLGHVGTNKPYGRRDYSTLFEFSLELFNVSTLLRARLVR